MKTFTLPNSLRALLILPALLTLSSAYALDCPVGQKKYYVAYQALSSKGVSSVGANYVCGDSQQTKTEEGLNQIQQQIQQQARKQNKGLEKATIVITNIMPLDR
ncbi:hypothetical protein [Undibacterium sp.]|uniref:hypothetical protein n=1 Tax=Undibacterium sp. TaxID=1914977 RepID=UPI0025E20C45|nr:hypothetical protein [Undibacterium sp.]